MQKKDGKKGEIMRQLLWKICSYLVIAFKL